MRNNDQGSVSNGIIPNNKKVYQAIYFKFPEMLWTWSEHEDWEPGKSNSQDLPGITFCFIQLIMMSLLQRISWFIKHRKAGTQQMGQSIQEWI